MLSVKRGRIVYSASTPKRRSSPHIVAAADDLLMEILLRLPITSLLRFKSVSKRWFSIITDPHFSRRRNPNPNLASGLFLRRPSCLVNPEFDFLPLDDEGTARAPFRRLTFVNDPHGIKILQSCNGLLCCCSFHLVNGKCNYYIYNPTTNRFATLPDPKRRVFKIVRGIESVLAVNLAFDPSKSPHYKLVCVYLSDSLPNHHEIEIYSSETGLWTPSGDRFPALVDFLGVFWNGAIHWISREGDSLYFNVELERLRAMPMPPMPDFLEARRIRYFGESGGHLHLIETDDIRATLFNVYEMERDYSKWFVKHRVDLDSITTAFPEMIYEGLLPSRWNYHKFSVLSIVRRENDEDSFMALHIPGKAIRYNFGDRTFKKLCDFAPGCPNTEFMQMKGFLQFGSGDSYQYIESLSCV